MANVTNDKSFIYVCNSINPCITIYYNIITKLYTLQSYSTPRAFIAAQSPMSNTRDDFWEVVWQTKPLTIVLLCDFNEMGIVSSMIYI